MPEAVCERGLAHVVSASHQQGLWPESPAHALCEAQPLITASQHTVLHKQHRCSRQVHEPRASSALPACHMKRPMNLYALHMAEPAARCSPPAVTAFSPISLTCSMLSLLLSCASAIVAAHLYICHRQLALHHLPSLVLHCGACRRSTARRVTPLRHKASAHCSECPSSYLIYIAHTFVDR